MKESKISVLILCAKS